MAPCSKYMNRRARDGEAYTPTVYEHIANVVTHGLAVVPALFYCRNLLRSASNDAEYRNALLYGTATVSLFLSSTIYHSVFFIGKWRNLRLYLHIIDRATIYVFIAASYTPWLSLKPMGLFGEHMRWIVWLFAFLGTLYQCMFHEKYKLIEMLIYLFTGVFPAVAVLSMEERSGLHTLAYGGVIYIIGVIFFKCDGLIPYAHAIWHLHVLAGATFHYYAVNTYLMGHGGCDSPIDNVDGMKLSISSVLPDQSCVR